MKSLSLVIFCLSAAGSGVAQRNVQALPKEAVRAKTVAIVNDTHNDGIVQGATEALKRWGRFTVVDDTDTADTLTFDKKSDRTGASSQKPGADGKTDYSYGITMGSSINMKAVLRGAAAPFYTDSTSESKKKAGSACVVDLQQAFNSSP